MVGDGAQLRTAEAAERLNVSESTVVKWERHGLLRATRTAGGGRGRGHRRIERASVDELLAVLAMPTRTEEERARRDARLVALADHNRNVMAGRGGGHS